MTIINRNDAIHWHVATRYAKDGLGRNIIMASAGRDVGEQVESTTGTPGGSILNPFGWERARIITALSKTKTDIENDDVRVLGYQRFESGEITASDMRFVNQFNAPGIGLSALRGGVVGVSNVGLVGSPDGFVIAEITMGNPAAGIVGVYVRGNLFIGLDGAALVVRQDDEDLLVVEDVAVGLQTIFLQIEMKKHRIIIDTAAETVVIRRGEVIANSYESVIRPYHDDDFSGSGGWMNRVVNIPQPLVEF